MKNYYKESKRIANENGIHLRFSNLSNKYLYTIKGEYKSSENIQTVYKDLKETYE